MAEEKDNSRRDIPQRIIEVPDLSDITNYRNERLERPWDKRIEKSEKPTANDGSRGAIDTTSDTRANKRFGDSTSDD